MLSEIVSTGRKFKTRITRQGLESRCSFRLHEVFSLSKEKELQSGWQEINMFFTVQSQYLPACKCFIPMGEVCVCLGLSGYNFLF